MHELRDDARRPMTNPDESLVSNRALWDEWTAIHETSDFYDLEGFRRGGVRLKPNEVEEIGDVAGKDLLHSNVTSGLTHSPGRGWAPE